PGGWRAGLAVPSLSAGESSSGPLVVLVERGAQAGTTQRGVRNSGRSALGGNGKARGSGGPRSPPGPARGPVPLLLAVADLAPYPALLAPHLAPLFAGPRAVIGPFGSEVPRPAGGGGSAGERRTPRAGAGAGPRCGPPGAALPGRRLGWRPGRSAPLGPGG